MSESLNHAGGSDDANVSETPDGTVSAGGTGSSAPQAGLGVAEADADTSFGTNPVDGAILPCEKAKGTPVGIGPRMNSIVCTGGRLVVQNNNTGPDRACTQAHEGSHIKDWKDRYGEDLCKGVRDGQLPVGGEGYAEFLRQSECKAYKVGKACRTELLKTADKKDQPATQDGISRDDAQIKANKCE